MFRYSRLITFALAAALTWIDGPSANADTPALSPEVSARLAGMADAYRQLKTLSLGGTIELTADINGHQDNRKGTFAAAFQRPFLFRHEVTNDVIVAATGQKIYVYLPTHNLYAVADAPAAKGTFLDLSDDLRGLLKTQDLSLVLALSADPAHQLIDGATSVQASEVAIGAGKLPALQISFPDQSMTVVLDPSTHLIRRVILDESAALRQRGADVKLAMTNIDYAQSTANAAIKPEQLAFTPPVTAQEAPLAPADANALAGKPAPHFRIARLDGGGQVSDADLHGSVYILDFWATWCGPCRQSLPGLDAVYQARKAAGLKVFAVNLQEDPADIRKFLTSTGLGLPVLLDTDAKTGMAFGADAIPQTVVVGRDGVVRNVFIGAGHERDIAAAADAALGR